MRGRAATFWGAWGLGLALGAAQAQNTTANEGGDVAFGGAGSGAGQFIELRDITFDARGFGYALDGTRINPNNGAREGNLRVQKFDATGKILGVLSVAAIALGDKQNPQRVAALRDGTLFVTQPEAGVVQVLGSDGKAVRQVALPNAMAVTAFGSGTSERIAVLPSRRAVVEGRWQNLGGDKIVVLAASGAIEREISLERKLEGVQDLTSDRQGNFYAQAEPNAIYKISPEGKMLRTWGGNPTTRNPDGSEVLHTVAVDSKGNVYTMAWGNPGLVTRFDADGLSVTQREGQFQWADAWSLHSGYTPLAIDPSDRLWAGATHRFEKDYVHLQRQRAAPAIVRASTDFFEAPANAIKKASLLRLGFRPSLACALPQSIASEAGKPIAMSLSMAASRRAVTSVGARWSVVDASGTPVSSGQLDIPLRDGEEARASFSWTPPSFGYYFVRVEFESGGQGMGAQGMGAIAHHVGVSPRFANTAALAADGAQGAWADAQRQMWSGLPNMRIHPASDEAGLKETDAQIARAEQAGATFFLQIVDKMENLTPEHVRRVATRYKGRVRYYEVCNEPNFSSDPAKYFQGHKMAYELIKAIDPAAQVMGPGTVNIDLNWLQKLYELGFKDVSDIVSLHDYEGHESITPEHWQWKFGQARKIMAAHGDARKPIWQTERAITGVRGNNFMGLQQAIRATLHRDLLESLGIPSEHNNHYYLSQRGFSSVPSYIWSDSGPHPAALALRTRHAQTSALGRKYLGALDFGPTGNSLFMGTRYGNAAGETIVLRNLGSRPLDCAFSVAGATSLQAVDCWGNLSTVRVQNGRVSLPLEQMPLYIQLAPGAKMSPIRADLGRNIAAQATWKYTAASKGGEALLTNGELENFHEGNPRGGTDGAKIWSGEMPMNTRGEFLPQTLEATFARPQSVSAIVLRGVRPDNQFCALLEYDLDYFDGNAWKSISKTRASWPASQEAATADATHAIWPDDSNLFVHLFPTVRALKLRLTARRVSFGFVPDSEAKAWAESAKPQLMLREVEIYATDATSSPAPTQPSARNPNTR